MNIIVISVTALKVYVVYMHIKKVLIITIITAWVLTMEMRGKLAWKTNILFSIPLFQISIYSLSLCLKVTCEHSDSYGSQ